MHAKAWRHEAAGFINTLWEAAILEWGRLEILKLVLEKEVGHV